MSTRRTPERVRAILVSLDIGPAREDDQAAEAARLVDSAGAAVVEVIRGRRDRPDAKTFAGSGKVEQIHLSFTVQTENYREMGDAVDLADRLGVTGLYFGKITNWGTFTADQYRAKAVFQPAHPFHRDFVAAMRDPRLRTARVNIGNLIDFIPVAA